MDDITRDSLLTLSESEPVGLIYSRADLNHYFLEILEQGKSNYLHQGNELRVFANSHEASATAHAMGANVCYLCLDNTYDECGAEPTSRRFSYLKHE